jgi:hypothetical protein
MTNHRKPKRFSDTPFTQAGVFDIYQSPKLVMAAEAILDQDDQTEEAFLGAQAVLLLNGLL